MNWQPFLIMSQIQTRRESSRPYHVLVVQSRIELINKSQTRLTISEHALIHLFKLLWNVDALNGRDDLSNAMKDVVRARLVNPAKVTLPDFGSNWIRSAEMPGSPTARQVYSFPISEEIEDGCLCFAGDPRHAKNLSPFGLSDETQKLYFDWMPKFSPIVTMLTYLTTNRESLLKECGFCPE